MPSYPTYEVVGAKLRPLGTPREPRWGWPCGRVVKFTHSAAGGPVCRWFESWARTWHCSSNHAEALSHMPQLEGPTTRIYNYVVGGFGEKK